jgi:hypothetical protein
MATITVPIIGNNIFQADKTFTVSLSNPRSSAVDFAPQQTFAAGTEPFSVAVGDFNRGGKPDLVVANRSSNTVSVLLNTTPTGATTPTFAPQQTFATGSFPPFGNGVAAHFEKDCMGSTSGCLRQQQPRTPKSPASSNDQRQDDRQKHPSPKGVYRPTKPAGATALPLSYIGRRTVSILGALCGPVNSPRHSWQKRTTAGRETLVPRSFGPKPIPG